MKYADSHEWIRVEGEQGVVGISSHAQKELGEIVYVQLPEVGQEVKAGEEIAVLESTKAAADIYSPVSGKVVSVNKSLNENVTLINQSPEEEGYLFDIALSHPEELEKLFTKDAYLSGISS